MAGHVDILDQQQRMTGSFWGSVMLHGSVAGLLIAYHFITPPHEQFGEKNGGGMGSVTVNPVASIPLPSRQAPPNPVANNTESQIPTPPKQKVQPKVKAPEPDAVILKSKKAPPKKETRVETSAPNKFREQQHYESNQLYSDVGQRVSSPMYQMPGAGGVGIGTNNPLGTQFGWYAKLIINQVASKWQTAQLNPRIQTAPVVTVTFTILKDGSVPQNSIKVTQSSGILPVDISAQRAVMDAGHFPPLPPGFTRDQADVELRFELKR
jgi:protein TonB